MTAALVSLALPPTVLQAAPGDVDSTFNPPPNLVNGVKRIIPLPDGASLWLGSFNHPQLGERKLIRLSQDGGLVGTFTPPELVGDVSHMAVQTSGSVLLAGRIEEVNGQDRGNLVRLNPDGTVDLFFVAGAGPVREGNASSTSSVTDLLVDDQDRVFLSGDFEEYAGESVGGVLRLSADGALEFDYAYATGARVLPGAPSGFVRVAHSGMIVDQVDDEGVMDPLFNLTVDRADPSIITGAMNRGPNGHLLFGKANNFYPFGRPPLLLAIDSYGRSKSQIVGTDVNFGPSGTAAFSAGTTDAAGRLVFGGNFTSVLSVARTNLVRVWPNGTVDETFKANAGGFVLAMATGSTGGYLVAGSFTTINGTPVGGIARLVDNDPSMPAELAFVVAGPSVFESEGSIHLTVLRQGDTNQAVSVSYATSEGTALEAVDYISDEGTLEFAAGESVKEVVVEFVNDEAFREERTFSVILSDPVGATLGGIAQTEVTIVDDDDEIGFYGEDVTVVERAGNVVLELVRKNTNIVSSASYTVAGAQDSSLVDLTGGSVEFEIGVISGEVQLHVMDDAVPELDAYFEVILAPQLPALGGEVLSRMVQVLDDDSKGFPGLGVSALRFARVNSLLRDSEGRLVVGGIFDRINGSGKTNLAQISPHTVIDDTGIFGGATGFGQVRAIKTDAEGRYLVGGDGSSIAPRGHARFNSDGNVDDTYTAQKLAGSLSRVFKLEPLPDGRTVIVGGAADSPSDSVPVEIVNPDGSVNQASIESVAALMDGVFESPRMADGLYVNQEHIYVGRPAVRSFETVCFRMTLEGLVDDSFSINLGPSPGFLFASDFANGGEGKIIVVGWFASVDNIPRGSIARVDEATGALDQGFAAGTGADGWIQHVHSLETGGYLIVGSFSHYDGQPRPGLARITNEGLLDDSFNPNPGPEGFIFTAWPDTDGTFLVGGSFTHWNGIPSPGLVHLDSSGKPILTAPNILSAQRTEPDQLSLELEVQPDVDVRVLRSTDLENWSPVSTNRTARRVLPVQLQTHSEDHEFFQAERLDP